MVRWGPRQVTVVRRGNGDTGPLPGPNAAIGKREGNVLTPAASLMLHVRSDHASFSDPPGVSNRPLFGRFSLLCTKKGSNFF